MNNFIVPELGSKPVGLVAYLFGAGRHNEHTDQRVIAASPVLAVRDSTCLDHRRDWKQVMELGHGLDRHRKALGVEMKRGYLWHCAISLPPEESTPERRLSDEQWAHTARRIITAMGFDAAPGRAGCRWLAVHHGQSEGGNEHIHLVVNLVREDGQIASTSWDRVTLSQVCAELEEEFDLQPVPGRAGMGSPGLSRTEIERSRRQAEPDRTALERTVRAAATAGGSEEEFLAWLSNQQVHIRPRYAKNGDVVGYAVARGTEDDHTPVWFGGANLRRDLALPKLRAFWGADNGASATDAWRQAAESPLPHSGPYADTAWEKAATTVQQMHRRLSRLSSHDPQWLLAAREAAGVFAAWATRDETGQPGPLALAATTLASFSQPPPAGKPLVRKRASDLRGVAMVVLAASRQGQGIVGQLLLLQQLTRLFDLIALARSTRQRADRATASARLAHAQLQALHRDLSATAPPAASPALPPPTPPAARGRQEPGLG